MIRFMSARPLLHCVVGLACACAVIPSMAQSQTSIGTECPVDQYHFNFGASAETNVYVSRNTPCQRAITIQGSYTITSFSIELKASHGLAGVSKTRVGATLHLAYKPAPGFVGDDEFAVKVRLARGADQRDSIVTYHVIVK
jgi:hypothetical protein